jgi:hypothetical protein
MDAEQEESGAPSAGNAASAPENAAKYGRTAAVFQEIDATPSKGAA